MYIGPYFKSVFQYDGYVMDGLFGKAGLLERLYTPGGKVFELREVYDAVPKYGPPDEDLTGLKNPRHEYGVFERKGVRLYSLQASNLMDEDKEDFINDAATYSLYISNEVLTKASALRALKDALKYAGVPRPDFELPEDPEEVTHLEVAHDGIRMAFEIHGQRELLAYLSPVAEGFSLENLQTLSLFLIGLLSQPQIISEESRSLTKEMIRLGRMYRKVTYLLNSPAPPPKTNRSPLGRRRILSPEGGGEVVRRGRVARPYLFQKVFWQPAKENPIKTVDPDNESYNDEDFYYRYRKIQLP